MNNPTRNAILKVEVNDTLFNPFLMNPVRFGRRTEKFGVLEGIEISHAVLTDKGLWLMGCGEDKLYTQFQLDDLLILNKHELKRLNMMLEQLKIEISVVGSNL